jgi:hypothetical protein
MRRYDTANWVGGLTLRQAALVAGLAYLSNPVMFAEMYAMPRLVVADAGQTVVNITAHPHLFAAAVLAYLVSLVGDVVIAWSLYVLLAPVNRALSMLAAWFQITYAAISLAAVANLGLLYRLLLVPDYAGKVSAAMMPMQAALLIGGFRSGWNLALILFGLHLMVLGWLVARSNYIPKWIGWLLVVAGLAWVTDEVMFYLSPTAGLGYLSVCFGFELVFAIWLLGWGWRLKEPTETGSES